LVNINTIVIGYALISIKIEFNQNTSW